MFDGIVAAPGVCAHCDKRRMLAHIPPAAGDQPYEVAYGHGDPLRLCAGCIYKLTRLAGLLLKLEAQPRKVKPTPKKARKPRTTEPGPITEHRDPSSYDGGSLVPVADDPSS